MYYIMKQNLNDSKLENDVLQKSTLAVPNHEDNAVDSVEVPPRSLYGHDLKKLKSFKKIRQGYKKRNMKNVFINDLSNVLKEFSPDQPENELNDELLIEIMQIAEEYYIYPSTEEDRNNLKTESVVELMLPYFRGDPKLLEYTMKHAAKYVKKIGKLRRIFKKLKLFFLPRK